MLFLGGKVQPIKGMSTLRQAFKADVYKTAKLVPRPFDVDYAMMVVS